MNSTLHFRLAVAGILVLLVSLSSLACQGDLFFIAWASHYVSEGHLNVYQTVFEAGSPLLVGLTYPPLTYLYFGALIAIGKLFGLFQYVAWNAPVDLRRTEVFFIRMFYLPFLVLLAWTCKRFAERFILEGEEPERRESLSRLAFLVTLTSPICLFVGFIMGQFDLLPASLLFLGVYLMASRRLYWGMLAVFAGVWLKNFPVVFVLFAAPILWMEFGWKRTLGAFALCGALTLLITRPFRSPGFKASYLAFQHHDYGVIITSGMGINVSLSNVLFLVLFVVCAGLALFRNRLVLWEKLLFAYAGSMIALLAPRFWMPQYMSWVAPVLVLFVLLLLRLRSPLFPAIYLGANAIYLGAILLLFPGNVDTPMFARILRSNAPPLGEVLAIARFRNEFWTAMSICLLLVGALITCRLFYWEKLRDKLESTLVLGEQRQLGVTAVMSLMMYVGFIVAHVLNLYMHRRA